MIAPEIAVLGLHEKCEEWLNETHKLAKQNHRAGWDDPYISDDCILHKFLCRDEIDFVEGAMKTQFCKHPDLSVIVTGNGFPAVNLKKEMEKANKNRPENRKYIAIACIKVKVLRSALKAFNLIPVYDSFKRNPLEPANHAVILCQKKGSEVRRKLVQNCGWTVKPRNSNFKAGPCS